MRCTTKLKPCLNLIDLTPLVDVIFLMLIFFLITSDTLPLKSLLIQHPQISSSEEAKLSQLVLIMDKDQVIYVGSKKEIVDLMSIKETLHQHISLWKELHHGVTPTIVLSIDRRVSYETFIQLFSEVLKAAPKVRLAFRTERYVTAEEVIQEDEV
jgi:biopolymer transport protein ExbD